MLPKLRTDSRTMREGRSRRREEKPNSETEQHEAKERNNAQAQTRKRHRAAALQDLAEGVEHNPSRQRLGVRQPYAAFTSGCSFALLPSLALCLGLFLSALILSGCGSGAKLSLVPRPAKTEIQKGDFQFTSETKIIVDAVSEQTGHYLAAQLQQDSGQSIPVQQYADNAPKGSISLTTKDAKASLGAEGYELAVTPDSIVIRPKPAGLFTARKLCSNCFRQNPQMIIPEPNRSGFPAFRLKINLASNGAACCSMSLAISSPKMK